ncbi:MAG: low molecular weight phosphotyrosine protein phosphatase [Clostridia bacterium]|nr:low molecular weight phosphotyrosine protein phosphatase [Clostridia bacterium]
MRKIMFVCHGNICRSPMAEFMCKDMLNKMGVLDEFTISSSATSSEEIYRGVGNPVYPPAKRELQKHGISCDGKRAVQLQKSDYEKYDLFVCMDNHNIYNALSIFGSDKEKKVKLLLDFTGSGGEVADPWYYGGFDKTYDDIEKGLIALIDFIQIK